VIGAEGGTLRVDSNLIGFPSLVERCFAAAERNGVAISEMSRLNASRVSSVEGNQP
jgi:hypothetical protein